MAQDSQDSLAEAKANLAKAGDECETCREFWTSQGKRPRRLVALQTETDYGIEIVVCPYCDGSPIIRANGRDE